MSVVASFKALTFCTALFALIPSSITMADPRSGKCFSQASANYHMEFTYGERATFIGERDSSYYLILWTGGKKVGNDNWRYSWTITKTSVSGYVCIIHSGGYWDMLYPKLPGEFDG